MVQTDDFDTDNIRRRGQRPETIVESSADAITISNLDGWRFVDEAAEEIADSLDIASPTLHRYARTAQRGPLAAFFDRDSDRP